MKFKRRGFLNLAICLAAFILGTIAAVIYITPEKTTDYSPAGQREVKPDASKPIFTETTDRSEEIKSENRHPIIEIWKDRQGSVTVRGESLHFRLYNDGAVEFDYELRRENETGKPRYIFYHKRTPAAKICDEGFNRFKSLLDGVVKDKNIKREYKSVGLIFDVIEKLTIRIKENETAERKIIINNSEFDVMDSRFGRVFPSSLVNLIKEAHLMRSNLQEKVGKSGR